MLVDRLWPRGVKKELAAVDEWLKDIAPSNELRAWFDHDPAKFQEFKTRYMAELQSSNLPEQLLERVGPAKALTLVYSAKDSEHNQAAVLREYLQRLSDKNK